MSVLYIYLYHSVSHFQDSYVGGWEKHKKDEKLCNFLRAKKAMKINNHPAIHFLTLFGFLQIPHLKLCQYP